MQEGEEVAQLRPTFVKNQFGKTIKVLVLRTDTDNEEPDPPDPPVPPGPDIGDYVKHLNGLKDDITIEGQNNIWVEQDGQKIIVKGNPDVVNQVNGITRIVEIVGGKGIDVNTEGKFITVSLREGEKEKDDINCNEWSGEYDTIDNSFSDPSNDWSDTDDSPMGTGDGSSGLEGGQIWSQDDCRAVNNDFK